MGDPISGHSLEWQHAYLTAAPEDGAQKQLVAQLARPMGASQTREQAQRVDAMKAQIAMMEPATAQRIHDRLSDPRDSLGKLFHQTLHRQTRKSLMDLLRSRSFSDNRATNPTTRMVDNRGGSQPPPKPTGGVPPPKPPEPPLPDEDEPPPKPKPPWRDPTSTKPPVKDPTPQVRQPPYKPPRLVNPTPPGMQHVDPNAPVPDSWVGNVISHVAAGLGVGVSVGLAMLNSATARKAIEYAWVVFQIYEGGAIRTLYGLAGEAAARALLAHALNLAPDFVRDLNDLESNFPVLDLINPRGLASVKVKGVVSGLPRGQMLDKVRSEYTTDLFNLAVGDPAADKRLERAARLLVKHKRSLGNVWPKDLTDTSVNGVMKYIREKATLMVPADHVALLRQSLGTDLARRIQSSRAFMDKLGLNNTNDVAKFVNGQIDRIVSMGVTTTDLQVLAETARAYVPDPEERKWHKQYDAHIRERKRRGLPLLDE